MERCLLLGAKPATTVLASAELYDPATGTFTATGSHDTPRAILTHRDVTE